MTTNYTSTNYQKHTHKNPLQRWLITRFHRVARELFDQMQGRHWLDVGCGEGFAMRELFRPQADTVVVGMDLAPAALRLAQPANPAASFLAGDALHLPFAERSFDGIICMEVLEHLENPAQGLAELRRVARRALLLSVPNEPLFRGANFLRGKNLTRLGNDIGHVQNWSARAFVRFVSQQCTLQAWRTSFPWTLVLCHPHED